MRTYDLHGAVISRAAYLAWLVLFSIGLPAAILISGAPAFALVPVLAIAAWNWWFVLTLAHRVVIYDDGALEWVSLARRVRMLPEDVRRVAPERGGNIGLFVVRHAGGKVRFIHQITGFHEVLVHVKTRNPAVELRGC
jgi:hypothetical protein